MHSAHGYKEMSYQIMKRHGGTLNAHSNYMTFWEKQNHRKSKKISGCQEPGRGLTGKAQRIFRAVKTLYVVL